MEWFIFSVFATIMFGIQSFLYKSATEKKGDKFLVTLFFMITVEILAIITFFILGFKIELLYLTLILGFLFALFFFLKTISQLKALEFLPTNKVFPITTSSVILVVIYSIFFFNETLSLLQITGIILILLGINFIHKSSKKSLDYKNMKLGFLFAFLAILPGAAMSITNKYAAVTTNLGFFVLVTYLFSILISSFSYKITKTKSKKKSYSFPDSIKYGIFIGIVNFAGYMSLLLAMKSGPLSLIAAIHTSYIIITVILAKLIHKELLSLKQFLLVLLVILGVILLRF